MPLNQKQPNCQKLLYFGLSSLFLPQKNQVPFHQPSFSLIQFSIQLFNWLVYLIILVAQQVIQHMLMSITLLLLITAILNIEMSIFHELINNIIVSRIFIKFTSRIKVFQSYNLYYCIAFYEVQLKTSVIHKYDFYQQ